MYSWMNIIDQVNNNIVESFTNAAPKIVLAGFLLILSALCIRIVTTKTDQYIEPLIEDDKNAGVVNLSVRIGLWFIVSLTILSVLGFSELAQAFGTSSGFLAIAISYIMKDAIQEAVAGFYLMKDDDYFIGARITVDGVSGEIIETKIQRTKIRKDDGTIVTISNQKVEPKWLREPKE